MDVSQVKRLIFLAECNAIARERLGIAEPLFPAFMSRAEKSIRDNGPTRVLVDGDGHAEPPSRVKLPDGVTVERYAELVFVRADGWSLGSPLYLAAKAVELWRDEWVCIYDRRADCATPFIHGEVAEERLLSSYGSF